MNDLSTAVMLALASRNRPIRFFFRDDDGGWEDAQLARLVALFDKQRMPLDIAMIPRATTRSLADWLRPRVGLRLGVHQHGYTHENHEIEGRKCEFGPNRAAAHQLEDMQLGLERLRALFGAALDPIFTPPWNRCSATAVQALPSLGFRMLSRDITATPLALPPELRELPVAVDWQKHRLGSEPDVTAITQALAAQLQLRDTVGVMLHHARMVDADFVLLETLLVILRAHPRAECLPMRAFLPPIAAESAA